MRTEDAEDRHQRLKDALRYRCQTTGWLAERGVDAAGLYRWVRVGDGGRTPTRGHPITTERVARALGLPPEYMTPGGPTLWRDDLPFQRLDGSIAA